VNSELEPVVECLKLGITSHGRKEIEELIKGKQRKKTEEYKTKRKLKKMQ
jgi:hypothetical protein